MKRYKYDFYFASPFFTEEQVEREEFLKDVLRQKGFKVFSPKENIFLKPNATEEQKKECFDQNLKGILYSMAVFSVTNGKDMGTIWESGYAYALGIPIIYFCEKLPDDAQFNLMLAQSAHRVFMSRNELINCEDIFKFVPYRGLIE